MDEQLVELSVLGKIVPSKDDIDSINERAERLMGITERYFEQRNVDVEVRYAGSYAKGTFLSDPDLDMFIMFPEDVSRKDLEDIGLKAGKEIIGGELVYSEHPYTTGTFEGIEVDMVPCYNLASTEHIRTAVDRTPFHTEYIISHLDEFGKDQVRLLKKFMKGIGAYGAEQDSRGFSGYLCELLIVKYGSFIDALKAATEWKKGMKVEIEGRGPDMESALVVYDPVDPKRNVASAVHEDTLNTFIRASKAFLDDPEERFFFPIKRIPLAPEELEWICANKHTKLASVVFMKPDFNDDNLQGQLWKSQYALIDKMEKCDFKIVSAAHSMDRYRMTIVFELESDVLSKTHKHIGPPTKVSNSKEFLEKWKDNPYGKPYVENDRWVVEAERPYRSAVEFLQKQTATAGIGKCIDASTMVVNDHFMTMQGIDTMLLTELLDPKDPWDVC